MYIKILSNNDSYIWGGTLRPEKVTVGKLYEVLEVHSLRGYNAYAIHPDSTSRWDTWWIHEEDESGNSLRHHFIVFDKLIGV